MQAFRRVLFRHLNLSLTSKGNVSHRWTSTVFSPTAASVADRARQSVLLELTSHSSHWKVSPDNIIRTVRKCPEALQYSPSEWNCLFENLQSIGFSGPECLEVISKCPQLLNIDPKNLNAIWKALTVFKLSTLKLVPALVEKPYVLCNSPKDAEDKALEIINFAGGKNNALHVLNNCDNPFALSLTELKEVIEYVKVVMKVRRTYEICRSRVVECPLSKLKCRHTFLVQAGMYTPQDDDIPVTIPHSNPHLSTIVNTSDEAFATSSAKLTYEEYMVFKELFEKQMYEEIYGDSDDDDF